MVSPLAAAAVSNQTIQESMKLVMLVRAYQVRAELWLVLHTTATAVQLVAVCRSCCVGCVWRDA